MSNVLEKEPGGAQRSEKDDKNMVTITVDGEARTVPKTKLTSAELKALLGIAATQVLDIVDDDGTFHPVADEEEIKLHEGLVLVSHGRGGASS